MGKITYLEESPLIAETGVITIKLPQDIGCYQFKLDLQYIREQLKELNPNDLDKKIENTLKRLIFNKVTGMLTERDYRYLNYEMFYIDKHIRNTSTNKTVCKEQNYTNYIQNAVDKGFITEQDIRRYEMQVRARYDVHKNMKPEKLARRIKGEIYIRIKSRITYVKNLKMFEHITSIEDLIVKSIKKNNVSATEIV